MLFKRGKNHTSSGDFSYISSGDVYLDSACQTMRPQPVIDAINDYYLSYNACGGRVKYEWGRKVDQQIEDTRTNILKLLGKSSRQYACIFTLNTTYGLNLILSQLQQGKYKGIVTSDIEHNSVFLPTITNAQRLGIPRTVLTRNDDGSVRYSPGELNVAVVVLNTTSNIDGRTLGNVRDVARDVHKTGGILILDAAQSMAHDPEVLQGVDYDALCFSGHKMYGPSIGVIVAKIDLIESLNVTLLGGGTVQDVQKDSFTLTRNDPGSHLELGLQDYAGIIGLNAAIKWMRHYKPEGQKPREHQMQMAKTLFDGLNAMPDVKVLNDSPSEITSFYSDKIDAHRLAMFLSAQGFMSRSGYFCCHYYLHELKQLPPQLRVSLGLNNTHDQVNKFLTTLEAILKGV